MVTFLAIVFGFASVLLIVLVMLQSGKGAGMGIFGGGASSSAFGVQSGNILTKITTILGVLFFACAILIGIIISKDDSISKKWRKRTVDDRIYAPGYKPSNQTNKKKSPINIKKVKTGTKKDADKIDINKNLLDDGKKGKTK